MKATIKADGTLKVTPENETEAFALKKWIEAEPAEALQIAWNDQSDYQFCKSHFGQSSNHA